MSKTCLRKTTFNPTRNNLQEYLSFVTHFTISHLLKIRAPRSFPPNSLLPGNRVSLFQQFTSRVE